MMTVSIFYHMLHYKHLPCFFAHWYYEYISNYYINYSIWTWCLYFGHVIIMLLNVSLFNFFKYTIFKLVDLLFSKLFEDLKNKNKKYGPSLKFCYQAGSGKRIGCISADIDRRQISKTMANISTKLT